MRTSTFLLCLYTAILFCSCKKNNPERANCKLEQLHFDQYNGKVVYRFTYDQSGKPVQLTKEITFDSGQKYSYSEAIVYDNAGRLYKTAFIETDPQGSKPLFTEFVYDGYGNVASSFTYTDSVHKDSASKNVYVFDANKRLVSISHGFEFEYDANGNLIKQYGFTNTGKVLRIECSGYDANRNFYEAADATIRFLMAIREPVEALPLVQYSINNVGKIKRYDYEGVNVLSTDTLTYQYQGDLPVSSYSPISKFNQAYMYSCN